MIEIEELTKNYFQTDRRNRDQNSLALQNISLTIPGNSVTTIVGQNGSGKSTLLSILSGQDLQFEGEVQISGSTISEYLRKKKVAYAAESSSFPGRWKVRYLLEWTSRLYGLDPGQIEEKKTQVCAQFQLENILNKRLGQLSKGMRQRANLAQSLMNDCEIVIWDEPSSGLDWVFAEMVEDQIKMLKKLGRTILLSTHDFLFVKTLADQVTHLKDGSLRYSGDRIGWEQFLTVSDDPSEERILRAL